MANREVGSLFSAGVDAQAGRRVVALQLMTATRAELIRRPHRAEAVSAACGELVIALRAEVEITLHMSAAGRARRHERSPQKEIKNSADAPRHYKADQHPESRAHRPARRILADISHHQDVERSEKTPGDIEICAKTKRHRVMLRLREDDPEVVLHKHKDSNSCGNGP